MAKLKKGKHERFCKEYVKDLNATQAYIRSGYEKKGAKENASRLIANDNIKTRIIELQSKISERLEIKADDIAREFMRLGFHNIQDFLDEDGNITNLSKLPRSVTASVSSIKNTLLKTLKDDIGTIISTEIKFHSKERALESLGKHIGWFNEDNKQKTEFTIGTIEIIKPDES